jgi:hypothetical protein
MKKNKNLYPINNLKFPKKLIINNIKQLYNKILKKVKENKKCQMMNKR